ncbi:hypothetical protein [Paractinoplanes lichenicola]|uniref:Uncharacterized protein n=1 Tax=Paractinoplanes lichenicola TaxID=2802976 RepID=A0ABS1W0N8_9ACTN|nr:hypothetical protein [Actinoplanes lichenicola]MBL7260303.1 hypothetical protein [Actinoplanes lichenicola]
MKRWGAALACGLILASGLTSTAYAAEPATAVAGEPTAAPTASQPSSSSCAPLVEGHFGRLSAEQIGSGTIARGETLCHDVRLTAGRHFIQFTGFTALRSATLQNAQGTAVCTAPPGYQWECDVPAAGDYTVVVQNLRGPTPVDYKIAVTSEDPSRCTSRVGTAWNAPAVRIPAVGVEVQCVRFTGSAGERILAYSSSGRIALRDAADNLVCTVPTERNGPCELAADGLYRAISVAQPGKTASEIQVRSLSPVKGCPTVRPGRFGTPGKLSAVRCRTLQITEPGSYFIGATDANGPVQNFVIMAADGSLPCSTSGYPYVDGDTCTFTTAGTYTLIAGSTSSEVRDAPFAATFVPSTAPGCKTISAYGLDEPGKRGRFRAVGQVDCYQFQLPDGLETHLSYPAGATGAASPLPRVYGDDGTLLCSALDCQLSGSPTYRLLLTAPGGATGDYVFAFRRNAISESCRPWTPEVVAQFGPGRFTNCFTFTSDKTGEMDIALEKLSGSNAVDVEVDYGAGPPCDPGEVTTVTCRLELSHTTTLVLTGQPSAARYRITKTERGETPPPPTDPPPPATCGPVVPFTESRYGPLSADQIATATVPPGKLGCHPIHLSAGWHTLRIDGPPLPGSGWVFTADESSRECMLQRGRIFSCHISEAGDYTIKLGNESGTTDFSYRLVATLSPAPADCSTDISTAWTAPTVRLPQDDPLQSHCVRFEASAGERVMGFSESGGVEIYHADGTGICAVPERYTNPSCELTAGGTYVAASRGVAGKDSGEIQIRSVTAPVGCPVVEPGTPSTDPLSGIRCRRVTIPAAGTYEVRAVSEAGEQRSVVVLNEQGTPACGSGRPITESRCDFPAAGTYTLVVDGHVAVLQSDAFSATVAAVE